MRSYRGFIALFALVTLVVVKLFSDFALAEEAIPRMPSIGGSAQVLGTYRVTEVKQKSKIRNGTLCTEWTDRFGERHEADDACGKLVWVVRTPHQVALLKASADTTRLRTFLLSGTIFHPKCASSILTSEASTLFESSRLCRAIGARELRTRANDAFYFAEGLEPMSDAVAGAITTMATIGLPIGISTDQKILLPRNQNVPAEIKIEETLRGVILFIPSTVRKTYTLTRVGE